MSNKCITQERLSKDIASRGMDTSATTSLFNILASTTRSFLMISLEIAQKAIILGALCFAWTHNALFFTLLGVPIVIVYYVWSFLFPQKSNVGDTQLEGIGVERFAPYICDTDDISELDLEMVDDNGDRRHSTGQPVCTKPDIDLGQIDKNSGGIVKKSPKRRKNYKRCRSCGNLSKKAAAIDNGNPKSPRDHQRLKTTACTSRRDADVSDSDLTPEEGHQEGARKEERVLGVGRW
ncbi:uncharacterized protein BP5553_01359 [Venustampulla echinocandica]|uniref:Uncharacterized protein n=1 Tax=Venustampulla echinocandica TaxID=2656787 RepID=A0A370U0R8_9HELO|nr:uncharacterized protein BP5553_01359 [Venustampulla echinocandica]RDL41380.1 hypothetical protein BP5553_01359 [Venustampulla echinocandica]